MRSFGFDGTKVHFMHAPNLKGHFVRYKEGFAARLLAVSALAAVLSMGAPVRSFADADPARVAAAKELLAATGAAKQFDVAVPLITQQLENAFVNFKPDHAAEIKEVFRLIPEKFSQRKEELLNEVAQAYADKLTADEINEIVKFYKTPIGAKFVQLQPDLLQQTMKLGQAWSRKIGQEIEQEVRKTLKDRGVQL